MLDLQPITLTRLIDRLCDNGLIERRSDPERPPRQAAVSHAGRAAGARPADRARRGDCWRDALAGIDRSAVEALVLGISPPSRRTCARRSSQRSDADTGAALWLNRSSNRSHRSRRSGAQGRAAEPDATARARPRVGVFRQYRRMHPAGRAARPRGRCSALGVLPDGRPLHHDRQRLCRRAEGADHAGRLRQDAASVLVREGQHVKPATSCSRSIPCPSSSRLTQAQGKLDTVETQFNTLKSQLAGR